MDKDYLNLYGSSIYIVSILQNAPKNGRTMSVGIVWPTTDSSRWSRIREPSKKLLRQMLILWW